MVWTSAQTYCGPGLTINKSQGAHHLIRTVSAPIALHLSTPRGSQASHEHLHTSESQCVGLFELLHVSRHWRCADTYQRP